MKICEVAAATKDIGESPSEQHSQDRLDRCWCLLKLLSNARFLARQGLLFWGHDESSSNFHQLLLRRGEDDVWVATWVQKKTHHWTSKMTLSLQTLTTLRTEDAFAPFWSTTTRKTEIWMLVTRYFHVKEELPEIERLGLVTVHLQNLCRMTTAESVIKP